MNITQPEIIIVAVFTAFVSVITGFLTWLFGRRKSDAEIAEISARVYNELVEHLEVKVKNQGETIIEQSDKLNKMLEYVEQLERLLLSHNIVQLFELNDIKGEIGL